MRNTISLSQPLVRGNSDPFSASSVPITAEVNEYLKLGQQFYVLWAWPIYASALFRERANGDWEGSVRTAFRQPSEMHTMLAGGAYVRADRSPDGGNKDIVRATSHKTEAMSQLRESLIDKDPKGSAALLWTVLRLLALEYYAGNFGAAMWHHQAAKQIIRYHKFPDWHHDAHLTFFVAEVWICTALLQKPAPIGTQWGAGPLPDEPAVKQLESRTCPPEVEGDRAHGDVPQELRQTFLDIRKVSASMQTLENIEDEEQKFDLVTYLDARAAILKARLLTMWVDFNIKHRGASLSTADITFSACSIAALVFLNFIFMFTATKPNNPPPIRGSQPAAASSVLHKSFSMLHRDLLQLLKVWRMSSQTMSSELILWLRFIATLAGHACPKWEVKANKGRSLSDGLDSLGIKTSSEAKAIFKKLLYHEGLMDDYLDELIAIATKHEDDGARKFVFQQLNVHLQS